MKTKKYYIPMKRQAIVKTTLPEFSEALGYALSGEFVKDDEVSVIIQTTLDKRIMIYTNSQKKSGYKIYDTWAELKEDFGVSSHIDREFSDHFSSE